MGFPDIDQRFIHLDFSIRLGLFYAALFLIVGCFLPFFSVWLHWRGMSAAEISIISAMPFLIRSLFTPVVSYLSDKSGDIRLVIQVLNWGALATVMLLFWADGFWQILIVSAGFALFWTAVMPLTETVAMKGVRAIGVDYGRMRLWGSITFILASFLCGYAIDIWNEGSILWLLSGACFLLLLTAYILPHQKHHAAFRNTPGTAEGLKPIRLEEAARLLQSRVFWLFLLSASVINASHALYYAFGSLHWQGQAISPTMIGILWAIGVIAEIVLFAFSSWAIRSFGPVWLILFASLAAIVRWGVMAFDPSLPWLIVLQILHGLTFGAAHLGAIHFISQAVPKQYSATAQGLYASFAYGIVMGMVTFTTGPLYTALAGQAYLVMALFSVFALGLAVILLLSWDRAEIKLHR